MRVKGKKTNVHYSIGKRTRQGKKGAFQTRITKKKGFRRVVVSDALQHGSVTAVFKTVCKLRTLCVNIGSCGKLINKRFQLPCVFQLFIIHRRRFLLNRRLSILSRLAFDNLKLSLNNLFFQGIPRKCANSQEMCSYVIQRVIDTWF